MSRERMKTIADGLRLTAVVGVMIFVAASHFGCEEEPSRPASCGSGPFNRDQKTGICWRLSDNSQVDSECCNY